MSEQYWNHGEEVYYMQRDALNWKSVRENIIFINNLLMQYNYRFFSMNLVSSYDKCISDGNWEGALDLVVSLLGNVGVCDLGREEGYKVVLAYKGCWSKDVSLMCIRMALFTGILEGAETRSKERFWDYHCMCGTKLVMFTFKALAEHVEECGKCVDFVCWLWRYMKPFAKGRETEFPYMVTTILLVKRIFLHDWGKNETDLYTDCVLSAKYGDFYLGIKEFMLS